MLMDSALVPMGYKIRINDYIGQIRTEPGPRRAAGAAAPATPSVSATPAPAPANIEAQAASKPEAPGQPR
jgi:pyruvate/2-oxoglutarate dehydrogenase complex dihydrolipoamide acyltransferase (E2) component